MATITKGDTSAQEMRDSGRVADGAVTFHFNGALSAVSSAMPAKGAVYVRDGVYYRVKSRILTPKAGGMADGLITCQRTNRSSATDTSDEDLFEVDFAQLEKPLLAHPDFEGYANQVNAWRDAPAEHKAAYEYPDGDGEWQTLAGKALDAAKKIEKGIESYLVFAPVVRKTSILSALPSDLGRNAGKRAASVGITVAGSWEWLKTCDRCVQQTDGWQRIEEWTGADAWDEDLYEEASS